MDDHVRADPDAMARIEQIATSRDDPPVLMLNLNRYTEAAGFPDGAPYREYMSWLHHAVGDAGGAVLWSTHVDDTVIGCAHDEVDEILAVWYPSHRAFLDLPTADGADRMFAGRRTCVAHAVIQALPASDPPMSPEP